VDAIIHNGAMVKLDASFTSLEAPNVTGTVELLSLALSSKKPLRFIYVSGGLRTDIKQPFEEFAEELSTHLAYSRTKNLSDRIILAVAAKLPTHQRRVSVVKPGLLLGSVSTGYTKREDFLSQFIGVVGATRSCPRLGSGRWLYVSNVGRPAAAVVKQLHAEDGFRTFEATADGMFMSSLTGILVEEFGLTAQLPSWDEWTIQVTERVADPVMQHPISAIAEFKRYEDRLPLERQLPESMDAELRESLRSSVRYLARQT
jgi:thioester reductase-like protein